MSFTKMMPLSAKTVAAKSVLVAIANKGAGIKIDMRNSSLVIKNVPNPNPTDQKLTLSMLS